MNKEQKAARLKAALRDNLRKRKQQERDSTQDVGRADAGEAVADASPAETGA